MMPLPGGAAGARRHVLALRRRDRRLRLDVGAARDEQLDDVGMVFGDGPHQRRLRAHGVLRVDVGAAVEQQRDGLDVARSRRGHQRRLAAGSGGVHVGAGVEQPAQDRRVAVESRRRASASRRIASPPSRPRRVLISVSTVLRSFWRTAWCSGVDPSEPTLPSPEAIGRGEGGATCASVAGPSASRNPTISRWRPRRV